MTFAEWWAEHWFEVSPENMANSESFETVWNASREAMKNDEGESD